MALSVVGPVGAVVGPVPVLHLGGLHPFETALLALLAFGPFVVLGVVVAVLRRRDLAADGEDEER